MRRLRSDWCLLIEEGPGQAIGGRCLSLRPIVGIVYIWGRRRTLYITISWKDVIICIWLKMGR